MKNLNDKWSGALSAENTIGFALAESILPLVGFLLIVSLSQIE